MNEFDIIEEFTVPCIFEYCDIQDYDIFIKIHKEDDFHKKTATTQMIFYTSRFKTNWGVNTPRKYWDVEHIIHMNKCFLNVPITDDSDYYYIPYLFERTLSSKIGYWLKIDISTDSSLQNISIILTKRQYNYCISMISPGIYYTDSAPEYLRVINYDRKLETQILQVSIDRVDVDFDILYQHQVCRNTMDLTYSFIKIHSTARGYKNIDVFDSDKKYSSNIIVCKICDV